MKGQSHFIILASTLLAVTAMAEEQKRTYPLVDTGQIRTYAGNNEIPYPKAGEAYFGQDAQFSAAPFSFTDNHDGTVTDANTGLMWQQVPSAKGFGWKEAIEYCNELKLGGYDDWRIPTLKELFSISDFSSGWPYLDTHYFTLATGNVSKDEQYWTSNDYKVGTTHNGAHSAFGVNHVTGHIKAYPSGAGGPRGGKCVRAVRGKVYGENAFKDNKDGTITDEATGLMWMTADAGKGMEWKEALAYAESSTHAGYDDWRLPNVKELQSIVDYSGVFPAIEPLFECSPITNEAGEKDYPYYWTSTSAQFSKRNPGYHYAWYVAFGRAVNGEGIDTHGAGAVRFDTKSASGPDGEGGERYTNYVRLVRGGVAKPRASGPEIEKVQAVAAQEEGGQRPSGPPRGERPNGNRPGGELQGGPPQAGRPDGKAFIARLDKDGDGKVSKAEFDGPAEHFTQIDQNGDGKIDAREAKNVPPKGGPPQEGAPSR
ncbi:DUF1566 domain-containing protein [Verrucomicrobiaceae bacterium R5-34]|nr:DUF1566 domain-containing protein [Verrucomicrobiaceae bacterium R5-34]